MSYYENSQWTAAGGQAPWEHQTPPARSGANSAIPREESAAFTHQLEEVDRAVDNLVKSGKMFNMPGRHNRMGTGGRPQSMNDFGDARHNPSSNLQNFYANQRHQPSRGSNEAEQMMQAKRRMAAQRERELRNYHQEQQYNRTVLSDVSPYGNAPARSERALSPGNMSEDERRELIARQRNALYGEGPFGDTGGYVDESGTPRPGVPGPPTGPGALRGHSPLAYEYGRPPPTHADTAQSPAEAGSQSLGDLTNQQLRNDSNSSPQSNPAGSKGVFDGALAQSRTSNSSPGGSPPRQPGAPGSKPASGNTVAPIGTSRPSAASGNSQSAQNTSFVNKSTTPLPSPLSQGFSAPGNGNSAAPSSSGASSNQSTSADGVGLGGWGSRGGGWGNKSGLGVQASVWG